MIKTKFKDPTLARVYVQCLSKIPTIGVVGEFYGKGFGGIRPLGMRRGSIAYAAWAAGRDMRRHFNPTAYENDLQEASTRSVFVDGQPKGKIYRRKGRWMWQRKNEEIATDSFGSSTPMSVIGTWILRLTNGKKIRFVKRKIT